MIEINDLIEGVISSIAFGGEGILRYRGFVIFVPFTAPGDVITCQITELKKSFGKGVLIKLLEPGKNRTQPLCPYFGTCGGCQIQHLNDQGQLNYKLNVVKDALQRIGHLSFPELKIVPAQQMWAYRRHISLHLRPHHQAFIGGYIGIDNQTLIPIKTCPIFNEPHENYVIEQLQEILSKISNPHHQEGRVTLLKNGSNKFILSFHFEDLSKLDVQTFNHFLQLYPVFSGMMMTDEKKKNQVFGDPFAEIKIENLTFKITPKTFIQNNAEQSTRIYQKILELTKEKNQRKILDLYCGFGISSLLLDRQGQSVTGVEFGEEAIKLAKENNKKHNCKVNFILGNVDRVLPKLLKEKPDLILMNPPRTGLSKEATYLLVDSQAPELIYVSCMPSTLARDLGILCKDQYEIEEITAYDMFPQTAHVETVVHLKKKKEISNNRSVRL